MNRWMTLSLHPLFLVSALASGKTTTVTKSRLVDAESASGAGWVCAIGCNTPNSCADYWIDPPFGIPYFSHSEKTVWTIKWECQWTVFSGDCYNLLGDQMCKRVERWSSPGCVGTLLNTTPTTSSTCAEYVPGEGSGG